MPGSYDALLAPSVLPPAGMLMWGVGKLVQLRIGAMLDVVHMTSVLTPLRRHPFPSDSALLWKLTTCTYGRQMPLWSWVLPRFSNDCVMLGACPRGDLGPFIAPLHGLSILTVRWLRLPGFPHYFTAWFWHISGHFYGPL